MVPVPPVLPSTAGQRDKAALLPYQQAWVANKSPLKVCEKSRRTGLTWAEAADDVLIAAGKTGQTVYYIGYNQDMAIEYIDACALWARTFNYAASEIEAGIWEDEDSADKQIKTYTIKFPSGRRIVALSSRPANLRGKQGVVVIDEAAFHEKLPELLKAAIALLIWGGSVRVISTHNGVNNPFNALIHDLRAGKRRGTLHRIDFQTAVAQGLYRRVCVRLGKEWDEQEQAAWVQQVYAYYGEDAAEELDIVPRDSAGDFLPGILIDRCMIDAPVLRWQQPNDFMLRAETDRQTICRDWLNDTVQPLLAALNPRLQHVLGGDLGRSGDLTVFAPLLITETLQRRCPFLLELRNIPFAQQKQILFFLLSHLPNFSGAALDARGLGQQMAEETAEKYGVQRIAQVMLSDKWYLEHMSGFKSAFEDRMIEIPRHADIRQDLRDLKISNGIAKLSPDSQRKGTDGGQRHGDAAIALALAWSASENPCGPFESAATNTIRLGIDLYVVSEEHYTSTGWGTVPGFD